MMLRVVVFIAMLWLSSLCYGETPLLDTSGHLLKGAKNDYRRRLLSLDVEELTQLSHGKNITTSLNAAWLRRLRTRPEPIDESQIAWPYKQLADAELEAAGKETSHWFAGFVEGRTGHSVPTWWSEALTGHTDAYLQRYYEGEGLRNSVQPPKNFTATLDGEKYLIVGPGIRFRAIRNLWDVDDPDPRFGIAHKGESVWILPYSDEFSRRETGVLYCLNTKTEEIVWKAPVWGGYGGPSARTGSWIEYLEVDVQENAVCVFGSGTTGKYVESFDTKSGACLYRFSSTLWCWGETPNSD